MNKKNGFVGIMVANRNQRMYILKQYLKFNPTNMKIYCFTPSSINWKRRSIIGLHLSNHKWVIGRFPFPQVVYNRCYDITNQKIIKRLETVIGSDKCFNHVNQFNKCEIHNKLNESLVHDHLLETVPYSKENAAHFLDIHKVLYFKPCYGHQGKGVYRVEIKESGVIHISHHYFLPEFILEDVSQFLEKIHELIGSTPYIIQKGVTESQLNEQNFDIRALVQKNKVGLWSVTNVVSRIAHKGCFNTSICEKICLSEEALHLLYPPEMVDAIMGLINDISLKAADIFETSTGSHLGELSVDFVLDKDGHVWIIELNGKPQKDLYDEIQEQYRVYKRPLQYAQFLSTQ